MESQRTALWSGKDKKQKQSNTTKEEVTPLRTVNFDSRQVIQLYEEVEIRNLDIYSEVM